MCETTHVWFLKRRPTASLLLIIFFQCTVNADSLLKHIRCCIQGKGFIF